MINKMVAYFDDYQINGIIIKILAYLFVFKVEDYDLMDKAQKEELIADSVFYFGCMFTMILIGIMTVLSVLS